MSLIFWDTMLFVYWVEDNPQLGKRMEQIRKRMWERNDQLCTSALTLGEVLAAPYARGDQQLAAQYRQLLRRPQVEIIPFGDEAADHFARIRSDRSIAPADAIQLACAAQAQVDLFLTNDLRLARKIIPGIQFIADLSFRFL
jgi:predicted nucleic acid-binding protein